MSETIAAEKPRSILSDPDAKAILKTPKRACNRHDDCDAADTRARDAGHLAADHCHDDCCEDCFGC